MPDYGLPADATPDDADATFSKLKRWFVRDYNSHGQVNWRREAREDFAFDAGDQLNEDDKNKVKRSVKRRIGLVVRAIWLCSYVGSALR